MLCSLFFLNSVKISGQTLQDILDIIQVDEEGELITDDDLFYLEELIHQPIDINRASRQELEEIPLITPTDVSLILAKRKEMFRFTSIEEVTSIDGLSFLSKQLLPVVTTVHEIIPIKVSLRNRWVSSQEDSRIFVQTDISTSQLKSGFIFERDPLEPSLTDYASGYLITSFGKPGINFIVGDHQIITGYGLLFGKTARPIKNSENITSIFRLGKGLKPYRSTLEYGSLRGIAVEYTNRLGQWIASISSSPRDASIENGKIITLSTSGLHQSETSLNRKHNLQDQIALLSWQNSGGKYNYGMVLTHERWTHQKSEIASRPPKSYGALFGRIQFESVQIFGEIASYTEIQPSLICGISLSKNQIRWISCYRRYSRGFQGPRSQPFREWSSDELNETGLFQGVSFRAGNHRFFTYGDVYRQSSSITMTDNPVKGFESSGIWTYHRKRTNLSFRWKREEKSQEDAIFFPGDNFPKKPLKTMKENWRISTTTKLTQTLKLQLQGDRTFFADSDTTYWGHALSVKIHYLEKLFRISFNWVGFIADDFQSRTYVWDLNLPGEMRSKAFFPTGQSVAIFFRLTTATGATVSARIRNIWEFSRYTGKWFKPDVEGGFQMDIAF